MCAFSRCPPPDTPDHGPACSLRCAAGPPASAGLRPSRGAGTLGQPSRNRARLKRNAQLDFELGQYVTLGLVARATYLLIPMLPKYRSSFGTPFTEPSLEGNVFSNSLGLTLGARFDL